MDSSKSESSNLFLYLVIAFFVISQVLSILFFRLDCSFLLKFYAIFLPNKEKLRYRKVWVVGASSGIGKELALGFAELNCKLILTSTNQSKLEEVKNACLQRSTILTTEDIIVLAYNIADFKQNDFAFKRILDQFLDIDILICNAGKLSVDLIIDDNFDELRNLFDLNLFSHIYLTKMVIRHWLAIKPSTGLDRLNKHLVFMSSVFSIVEVPFLGSAYSATKRSLNIFAHDVAIQHQNKDGIYVNIIHPGPVQSDLIKNSIQKRSLNLDKLAKMKTQRCVHLILVAIANKLHESYVSNQPTLLLTYLFDNFYYYLLFILRTFNLVDPIKKKLFKEQL